MADEMKIIVLTEDLHVHHLPILSSVDPVPFSFFSILRKGISNDFYQVGAIKWSFTLNNWIIYNHDNKFFYADEMVYLAEFVLSLDKD